MDDAPRFKRVLLKLSGEALLGEEKFGISTKVINDIAKELVATCAMGVQVAVVVGGGNIFRGVSSSAKGMDRSAADYVGMLATMMNAIALQSAVEGLGLPTRVQSAIEMQVVAEPFIPRRAIRHLEKGRLVIFGAGTGNPYFTTDTASALRAMEIQAEVLFKATKVDGVYDKDPVKHADARRYDAVSFNDALKDDIKVMDSTAFALCRDNRLPVVVFDVREPGNIRAALSGQLVGTRIEYDETTRFAEA